MHYLLVASQSQSQPQSQSQSQTQTQTQTPEDSIPNPDHGLGSGNTMLSPRETSFLHAHQKLLARHYGSSFLGSFPPQLRRLDDNAGGTSMVQGPDAKEVVFARCLADEVRVVVPAGEGVDEELGGISMQMGDVWVVRWEGVREAWARGEVEVL
jgi:GINS complex subunit 4